MVINTFYERAQAGFLPVLQCLNRGIVFQGLLRDRMIIELDIAQEGLFQVFVLSRSVWC